MRILHVINSLSASGGAENGMVREVASLSDGFEHRVAGLFEKDQLDAQLEALDQIGGSPARETSQGCG